MGPPPPAREVSKAADLPLTLYPNHPLLPSYHLRTVTETSVLLDCVSDVIMAVCPTFYEALTTESSHSVSITAS